jgi:hypothetical protein
MDAGFLCDQAGVLGDTIKGHTALTAGYLEEALILYCAHAADVIRFTVNQSADRSGRGV